MSLDCCLKRKEIAAKMKLVLTALGAARLVKICVHIQTRIYNGASRA